MHTMNEDFEFAAPPFKPDQALARLERELRALGLSKRAAAFERRGLAIAKAALAGETIAAARVRRPSRSSPEWQTRTLRSDADLRDFVTQLKQQLALWSDRDE